MWPCLPVVQNGRAWEDYVQFLTIFLLRDLKLKYLVKPKRAKRIDRLTRQNTPLISQAWVGIFDSQSTFNESSDQPDHGIPIASK
jgi:hypothetical protein